MKKKQNPAKGGKTALHGGLYSLAITALVAAILIAINLMAEALPQNMTQYDISASKLYSVTSNTKMVLNSLEQDVTIYWVVQDGQEDPILTNLLDKYDSLSDHVSVIKKNPDTYPTFAEKYTDEEVKNNSLVVECGERSRFISLFDIYLNENGMDPQYTGITSFDGEGAITSAIDYVVNAEQPVMYVLEGHGEAELPKPFADQIRKSNIETRPFSLLSADTVPEDAAGLMIYAPSSDFSLEEVEMLRSYVADGGKLFVAAGPAVDSALPNLYSLISDFGIETTEGVVVEQDRGFYAFREPFALLPEMSTGELTDPLMEEHYLPILPIAQGLTIGDVPGNVEVTSLLTTSATSFSKAAGYNLTTYDKEEGDTDGPFTVAVDIKNMNEGRIVWFSSSAFLTELYNAYSSGANTNLAMNALSALVGESEAMAIRTKSLSYEYLTISESTASMLKVVMIGLFPLVYLGVGVGVVIYRRRKRRAAY